VAAAYAASGALALAAFTVLWFAYPFPAEKLARWPASPVVTDRDGGTLLALVGTDDQWRFRIRHDNGLDHVSPHIVKATIAVEDKRFRDHIGVDPIAVCRAAAQNLKAGHVVSGASTLTMQVCRMMDDRPRTLRAKLIESFRALQLERLKSKDEILAAYLDIAPYGGNIRGAGAASFLYFGKNARDLSLGEAALLAGLPQSPSRLRPDRYPEAARRRRRTVLARMLALGMIADDKYALASAEPVLVVGRAQAGLGESRAFHAAHLALARRPRGGRTTIDLDLQREVERLASAHARSLARSYGEGSDLAVVVIDVPTGNILALVGSADATDPVDGQVNGAVARRSPGSALKPFVYAAAFQAERLAPESVVHDVPIERSGWTPTNFDGTFVGELTAAEALRRSLNVPAILVAEGTGLARVVGIISSAGVDLPENAESRGGLGVVVGTVEVSLLGLTNAYATLGRGGVHRTARLLLDERGGPSRALDPNVCAAVNDILSTRLRRPRGLEVLAERDVPWFMWKTGTSSGRRDAWAVGHNGRVAVGVWVGRFSGAARLEFVGSEAAEPLMARLFSLVALRNDTDPPPPEAIAVRWPLPKPVERGDDLRITSPCDGSDFLGAFGGAVVRPRANRTEGVAWFLNGAFVDSRQVERLVLGVGAYELRCLDAKGSSSAVRFAVR
jgi:penicillin-binding protein 1C